MGKRSTSETVERMRRTGNTVVARLLNLTKPVIVGVNGPAVGGGFSLALVGDVVLMSRDAYFALAFADRGLVPDMGATFLLPRLVGLLRAKEMAFSGRRIDAQESLELGLATKLTDSNDLESELQDFAVSIAGRPTFALSLTKRLLNQSFDSSLSAMLEAEAIAQGVAVTDPEHTEAVKAFMRRTQLRK
jgi:2-(1,2-epoxy-1,2-dihydrophenyl)acetyl-CoA isomerase